MQANRRRDTGPELALRRRLHAAGLRYRVDHPLVLDGRRVRPDVVFARAKVAVFVDGCWWHGCPLHGARPRANREFWETKFVRNIERDRANDRVLTSAGWTVLRYWEHEDPAVAAEDVLDHVRGNSARRSVTS